MRIALYHDLPAGGALRFARDSVTSTSAAHQYTLFVAGGQTPDPVLAGAVEDVRSVDTTRRTKMPRRLDELASALAGQRAIADAIERDRFDLAVFHPAQLTQAPHALVHLREVPSYYYAPEPRRRSYEQNYQPWLDDEHRVRRTVVRAARRFSEPLLTRLDREATLRAGVIATNSSFSVEAISRAYDRQARLCHPGVRLEHFELEVAARDAMLLSVGALDPTKGHDMTVEAIARLPKRARPSLTIVYERCDERFRARVIDQAHASGVELELVANISDTALTTLYGRAAATVVAARLEPFGLTPLESIAVGTPVVAVREGGFRETVQPGVNGVLVERTPDALAVGITEVLELGQLVDPAAIRKSLLPYWSWERCIADYERQIREAANR